jgi:hypothetical protein
MTRKTVEQIVLLLADELSQTLNCRALIETQRQTLLGREIVELRVYLHKPPSGMAADLWLSHYRSDLVAVLGSAGLELAVDDWFTPTRQIPSCSCWIMKPLAASGVNMVKQRAVG